MQVAAERLQWPQPTPLTQRPRPWQPHPVGVRVSRCASPAAAKHTARMLSRGSSQLRGLQSPSPPLGSMSLPPPSFPICTCGTGTFEPFQDCSALVGDHIEYEPTITQIQLRMVVAAVITMLVTALLSCWCHCSSHAALGGHCIPAPRSAEPFLLGVQGNPERPTEHKS